MIFGVAASIERPERGASQVDVPHLNSFTQLYTVANTDVLNII